MRFGHTERAVAVRSCRTLGITTVKLVVQDGSVVSRKQLQAVVSNVPARLSRQVETVLVCASWESEFRIAFHPKARVLTLFVPTHASSPPATATVLREFLVALAVIEARGSLPARLANSVRTQAIEATSDIFASCVASIGAPDA